MQVMSLHCCMRRLEKGLFPWTRIILRILQELLCLLLIRGTVWTTTGLPKLLNLLTPMKNGLPWGIIGSLRVYVLFVVRNVPMNMCVSPLFSCILSNNWLSNSSLLQLVSLKLPVQVMNQSDSTKAIVAGPAVVDNSSTREEGLPKFIRPRKPR